MPRRSPPPTAERVEDELNETFHRFTATRFIPLVQRLADQGFDIRPIVKAYADIYRDLADQIEDNVLTAMDEAMTAPRGT